MISGDVKRNEEGDFYFLQDFHPFRSSGENNSSFRPAIDGLILDLKSDELPKQNKGIQAFLPRLAAILDGNFTITVVPSSKAGKINGISKLAKSLVTNNRIDGIDCLVRTKTIDDSKMKGNRSIQAHLDSIQVFHPSLIKNSNVLLLDDVATTGCSFKACKQLLEAAGARSVTCLAVGHTFKYF